MRKLILYMHMSLDGHVCGSNDEMDWVNVTDDEMGKYFAKDILDSSVDAIVIGKNLYLGFAQAWPAMAKDPNASKETVDFAKWLEDTHKPIFSNTLEKAEWGNSTIIKGDITEGINKLKAEEGKDMVVFGGAKLVQALVAADLVDEYRIKLEPKLLGEGKNLFKDLTQRVNLKLTKTKGFNEGTVALYYDRIS